MVGAALKDGDEMPPRRRAVYRLLLTGASERQIAAKLNMAPASAHEHVKRIYKQLRVRSRQQLMARVIARRDPGETPAERVAMLLEEVRRLQAQVATLAAELTAAGDAADTASRAARGRLKRSA